MTVQTIYPLRYDTKKSSRSIEISIKENGKVVESKFVHIDYYNAFRVYKAIKTLLECSV